jgi:Mg/Co/Ni transporter MgtE
MSIRINTDLDYLLLRLNISPSKMEEYKDKTIDEIIEAESAAGNQAAVKMAADLFTDVNMLIDLFQLADPKNKLAILGAMTTSQLEKLIPMLETKDLVEGLNFFTQASLLDMLRDIPKEELMKTVFQLFSETQVIEYMPEEELDKLLTGTDVDKDKILDALQYIPEMYLQQIIESITGEESQGNSSDLVRQIGQFGDPRLQSLPRYRHHLLLGRFRDVVMHR